MKSYGKTETFLMPRTHKHKLLRMVIQVKGGTTMKHESASERPVSESFSLAILLTISGGFLDAYTFCCRDQVFANAQTGNMVRVGIALAMGNFREVIRYLIPIFAFACGVYLAVSVRERFSTQKDSLWQQRVLVLEILVAGTVSFIPMKTMLNILSNILVSFLCAMQSESFRKVRGKVFNSTMCTGNLRSGTECLYRAIRKKDPSVRRDAGRYFGIILSFILGAVTGIRISKVLMEKAILIVALLLCCILGLLIWNRKQSSISA